MRGVLGLIAFTLLTPGMLFGIFFPHVQIFPGKDANVKSPADNGMKFESLVMTGPDGVTTKGWYLPPPVSPAPGVICVHGHRGRRDQFLKEAKFLHAAGFGVALLDLRHHGDSGDGVVTFGVREAEEVRPYLDFLAARPEHRGQKLGLIGWSMGAVTVLKAASLYPEVAAVVADSPFASLSEQSYYRVTSIVPGRLGSYCWAFALATGCTLSRMLPSEWEVSEWLPKIQPRPVFFIHGAADTNIPAAATRKLVATARPENVEVWYAEGVNHIDTRNVHPAEYAKRVTEFFQRTLK